MPADYAPAPLFLVRQEDLAIVADRITNRIVRNCAAALLNLFRRVSKIFAGRDGWFYLPSRQIQAELLNFFGKDAIRNAIAFLIELGFLQRRTNAEIGRNGQVKTYQYFFNPSPISELFLNPPLGSGVPPLGSDCSPIDQIYIQIFDQNSDLKERENFAETATKKGAEDTTRQPPTLQDLSKSPENIAQGIAEDHFPAAAEIPEKFSQWLRDKARNLPKKVQFVEKWLRKMAADPAVVSEYLKTVKLDSSASAPPPALPFTPQPESIRLLQLQAEWRAAASNPAWQCAIAEQIAEHPDWGITVGVKGPEQGKAEPDAIQGFLAATQPPRRVALPTCDPVLTRLARLQADWRAAASNPAWQSAIAEQIAEHPDWGFRIGKDGPEELEF